MASPSAKASENQGSEVALLWKTTKEDNDFLQQMNDEDYMAFSGIEIPGIRKGVCGDIDFVHVVSTGSVNEHKEMLYRMRYHTGTRGAGVLGKTLWTLGDLATHGVIIFLNRVDYDKCMEEWSKKEGAY